MIASPRGRGFRVVDAFSRIVRLGEGVAASGQLSDAAMSRTIGALRVCAQKMERRDVARARCIATQACRGAANGDAFLARVQSETGLRFEIISPAEEARLAVEGCAQLIDMAADAAVIFDIGGGSTEISWLDLRDRDGAKGDGAKRDGAKGGQRMVDRIGGWVSLPYGVVTVSERFGGRDISAEGYAAMAAFVADEIRKACAPGLTEIFEAGRGHLLGTSGTVTSIAGVFLDLPRYERRLVDGLWMSAVDARSVSERLRRMGYEGRVAQPCIGAERADLVVAGCAILEAILSIWPAERIRVADRGLREGVLLSLMNARSGRSRRPRRRKRRPPSEPGAPSS
ncbi:MAG: Ppx/GppA phosphatase family protein [Pseudomonadota bacterium]